MSSMIERIARAIETVQIWSRRNDLLDPPLIEICRYGREGEPEIVVLETASLFESEDAALHAAISKYRGRAVLEAMKEPTAEMIRAVPPQTYRIEHYHGTGHHRDFPLLGGGHEQVWRAMISKAMEG